MDQVLAAIHQGNSQHLPVTLAVARHLGEVVLCWKFPSELRGLVEGQLYAQYPDVKITPLPDDALDPLATTDIWAANLQFLAPPLPHQAVRSIRGHLEPGNPPSRTAILTAVSGEAMYSPMIELTIRPAGKRRVIRMSRCLRR